MLWRTSGVLAAMAIACGDPGTQPPEPPLDGGQIGEENGSRCEVVDRQPIGRDEVSPLGFAAGPLIDLAVGTHVGDLAWADDATTGATLTIADRGVVEFLSQEVVSTGDPGTANLAEPALWCPDLLSVGIVLGFETDDGAFAESVEAALLAEVDDRAWLSWSLDAVAGTFDPADHVPPGSDYDEVRAWFDLAVDASGIEVDITGQGSGVIGDPDDPDAAAYAENFDIASFGTGEPDL